MTRPAPRDVLVVRLGAVGDVIRTLPLVHALRSRRRHVRLGWVVEEASAALLREIAAVDEVHVVPRRQLSAALARPWRWPHAAGLLHELVGGLRERPYDLVLDAHGTLKAAVVARCAGARVVGLAPPGSKEGAHHLYDTAHPFPAAPMTRVRRALFLAAAEGLLGPDSATGEDGDPRVEFGFRVPSPRAADLRERYRRGPRPVVALFPFASARGHRKRWPLDRFVALGRQLASSGARVVMAWGSPRESTEARDAAAGSPIELAPPTDLLELAELLRACDLLVTGDTGPMHLAAAVGTRVVALFGPSDPVVNRPWGSGHDVIVQRELDTLDVDRVASACRTALASVRT